MSDISLAFPAAARTLPATVAAPVPRKRFGTGAILAWGAAGVAALFISVALATLFYAAGGIRLYSNPIFTLVPIGHLTAATVVVAALWYHRQPFREYLALVPMRGRDIARGVGYGVLGYLLLVVAFIAASQVKAALGYESTPQALSFDLQHGKAVALISIWITMIIAAPIAEELLFRGLLFRGLAESRIGMFAGVVLASVVFGLCHYLGFGWDRVFATGLIGFLFAWLRWRYENLGTCMVAHAVTNFIGASILTILILAQ
jgi:membrane protease YdiL (CAAX protease family)